DGRANGSAPAGQDAARADGDSGTAAGQDHTDQRSTGSQADRQESGGHAPQPAESGESSGENGDPGRDGGRGRRGRRGRRDRDGGSAEQPAGTEKSGGQNAEQSGGDQ